MSDERNSSRARLARYMGARIGMMLLTALFVSVVVFFAVRTLPGDPAMNLLGTNSTAAQRAALRSAMGLDQPLIVQFGIWLRQILTGNLGYSFSQARPVSQVLGPALVNTLLLGGFASVLAIVIGLVMGNLATSPWRLVRRTTDWFEAIFLSAPQYAVALLLLIGFAVVWHVFPAGGLTSLNGSGFRDELHHLVLPAIALALAPGAQMARSLKTSIATLQATELLPALRGRGLSPVRLSLHTHHNALPPMVTVMGIQVGSMLGGALFVETIFSIPGLGNLIVQSVTLRDYELVQGAALVVALLFIVALFLSDMLNVLLDPRIRVRAL